MLRLAALALAPLVACGARQGSQGGTVGSSDACRAARDHFQRALAAEARQGDFFDLAVHELKAAYDTDPRPEVLLHVALVHEEQGDFENGLIYCRRYLAASPGDAGDVTKYCDVLLRRLARQRISYEKSSMVVPATPEGQTAALAALVDRYEKRCPELTRDKDICEAILAEARRERDDPTTRVADLDTEDSDAAARARASMLARAADDPYSACGG
jgi:hypothetical protein